MDKDIVGVVRDEINARFCEAVDYLLKSKKASNKNAVMESLGLYLGRLSIILGGKANCSTDNLSLLCSNYGISPTWLLLGTGPMMADGSTPMVVYREPKPAAEQEAPAKGTLPLIPIAALAGYNGDDVAGVSLKDCVRYQVPEFVEAGADFIIRVQGNSMMPTFVSGDMVACHRIDADSWIEYGDIYVIDGLQGVMIKRIYNNATDQDLLMCHSDNPDVAPFAIRKGEVRSLSKVVGVIRSL